MKIRIKGNALRMRLSRSEVEKITQHGYIEEQTSFGAAVLKYALTVVDKGETLSASFENNKITMFVPAKLMNNWATNDVTGFKADIPLTGKDSLFLLLEKDFVCLDETTEDQSDNYENPNKTVRYE